MGNSLHNKIYLAGILLVLMFACSVEAHAQRVVRGTVVDSLSSSGLPAANAVLLNKDSSFVNGLPTDSAGHFKLSLPGRGAYILRITMTGYKTKYIDIAKGQRKQTLELGTISLPLSYVLLKGAESLSTRFRDHIGLIRSWDFNEAVWQYPVIIDNMMNLELLEWASKNSDTPRFAEIARSHADATKTHHFRPDYSCWHVVSYDTITGKPEKKHTRQGYSHESSWARGEAWALYGYTMMFRETQEKRYLEQAEHIADYILTHPRMPEDGIPYWDFDAPDIPNALRDASAGAVMASAFIELSAYTDMRRSGKCLSMAIRQLKTLTSPEYLAEIGTNGYFILKHSVGSLMENSEVDVPLTYADYYYVEALLRYKRYED